MSASRPAAFHLLLCGALVLYVYRVFVFGANLSPFRVVLIGWTLATLVDLVRGRLPLTRTHAAFAGLAAAIAVLNGWDFAGLAGYPALRRDILNHLQNVWFAALVALHVRTAAQVISLLGAFVWSSLLTSAITLASWALGALPFEGWLRAHGGPATHTLRFLGYDRYFHRAASAFYDPNFYGIYSALVIATALGLWLRVERRPWLLWLAGLNAFFLGASLSRTGLVALMGAFAVMFVLHRGVRDGRRLVLVAAAGTCALFLAASVVQSRHVRAEVVSWWTGTPLPQLGEPGAPRRGPTTLEAPPDQDRLTGSASVADRMRRIRHGWEVFVSAPWLGGGSAALLSPAFPPHASAHLVYLTLLARYGIVGTLVYGAFALGPLVVIARRRAPPLDALMFTTAACLALVYVSYDVFLAFELQYLFFGLAWALANGAGDRLADLDAGVA